MLATAIELADAEGLEAVTMRRLADQLGVVPMALYKHVGDKEDLVSGMVDALVDEVGSTAQLAPSRWRDEIRELLYGARRVVAAHPWSRRAIESRKVRTPSVLRHMERVAAVFLRADFTPDLTHHLMHLLGNRIWGFSPELFDESDSAAAGRSTAPTPAPGDYPSIMAIAADARARRPGASGCDEDFEFDFSLDVILDGAARLRRSHWASPA